MHSISSHNNFIGSPAIVVTEVAVTVCVSVAERMLV